jgi:hypothetical protein
MEDDMEEIPRGILIVFFAGGGLGTLLTGVGVLWFVTVYKEINEKKE